MSGEKILIIEDEPKVARFIEKGLKENFYNPKVIFDGEKGLNTALSSKFDLIILDLNLPIISGFEICRGIRKINGQIPILILTALGITEVKLLGFECGADDYIVKPFEFRELLARIKALLKRSNQNKSISSILKVDNLELNTETKKAFRDNVEIALTAKEFALLELLIKNKGKVFSRSEIAEKIWDINFDTGTNVIDVYINFLRKKIDKGHQKKLIHTHIGLGYTLHEP